MITYLILKRVRVQHANAMVSWNVVGAPSVTAHVGFSKALAFHYGLDATAVAILHHGMDHEGRYSYGRLQPNRVRGVPLQVDSRRSKFALSDQPFALAHYEASLVVRLEGSEEDTRTFRDATLESDGNIFSQRIQTLFRFAGGPIVSVADILISDYRNEALEKLPRVGHFVIDASEEIHPRHEGEDS